MSSLEGINLSYHVTRVVVKDTPPPQRPVVSVGHIYPIVPKSEPETVFQTVGCEDEKSLDDAETKVVKRRGRRPAKATEAAETK
jgi:hypothetical protein